jgi:hypothetical protein
MVFRDNILALESLMKEEGVGGELWQGIVANIWQLFLRKTPS